MSWWFGKNRDNEIERELRAHLELEAAEQREGGSAAEEETRYAARRTLGKLDEGDRGHTELCGRPGGLKISLPICDLR